jgi:hypothetical protein
VKARRRISGKRKGDGVGESRKGKGEGKVRERKWKVDRGRGKWNQWKESGRGTVPLILYFINKFLAVQR